MVIILKQIMEPVYIIYLLIIIYLIFDTIKKNKKQHPSSPIGPFAFPILGNIPQIKVWTHLIRKEDHLLFDIYSESCNGVIRAWVGDKYFLFISNYEMAKEILKNENYMNRPMNKIPIWKYFSGSSCGVLSSSDEKWLNSKAMLIKSIKKYASNEIMEEKTNQFIDILVKYENSKNIFFPKHLIHGLVLSVYCKYMFNHNYLIDNPESAKLGKFVDYVFHSLSKLTLFDCFNLLDPFYNYYLGKVNSDSDIGRKLIKSFYDDHLKTINIDNPRDVLDEMLIEYGLNNVMNDEHLPLHISQICFDVLAPSLGTLSIGIEWVILQLCNYQEFQEIAYKEIENTISTSEYDTIKLCNKNTTPYILAFIKETLRLKSNAFGVPKISKQQGMVGNYLIPKNAIIFLNYHNMGLDDNLYHDAKKFDPTRYFEKIPNFHFSIGPRSCLGKFIAIDQIYLCISNILLKYKIRSFDNKKIDDTEIFSISLRPKEFGIHLETRK